MVWKGNIKSPENDKMRNEKESLTSQAAVRAQRATWPPLASLSLGHGVPTHDAHEGAAGGVSPPVGQPVGHSVRPSVSCSVSQSVSQSSQSVIQAVSQISQSVSQAASRLCVHPSIRPCVHPSIRNFRCEDQPKPIPSSKLDEDLQLPPATSGAKTSLSEAPSQSWTGTYNPAGHRPV